MEKFESKTNDLPENWKIIDFHVHSPASFDFNRESENIDSDYLKILEDAKKQNLDILVITDHNTVSGYFKFLDIYENLKISEKVLIDRNNPVPENILEQINLFESISILPGLELDTSPNIHILIIIDPRITKEKINDQIEKSGFPNPEISSEISSQNRLLYVDDAITEWGKLGCIIIASHVDSDKGIYNESEHWGQQRIKVYKNEFLCAMEFNQPKTRDKIKSSLTDPQFSRDTSISFVQSSDYHNRERRLGDKKTFIKISNYSPNDKCRLFSEIKASLRNPDESISAPESPEVASILTNLSDVPSIDSFTVVDNKNKLLKYLVAYSNCEDGTFVIGKNDKGNWIGERTLSKEDFVSEVQDFINLNIGPRINFSIECYEYGVDRFILSIRVRKIHQLAYILTRNEVFIFEKNKPTLANPLEIADLVEENLLHKYKKLSVTHNLIDVSTRLSGLADTIDVLPIIRKVDRKTLPFKSQNPIIQYGEKLSDESVEKIDTFYNGISSGNLIILSPTAPRLNDSYLRFTAPLIQYDELETSSTHFSGPKILISALGGVFFDDSPNIIAGSTGASPLVITGIEGYSLIEWKFLSMYLKTSIPLWYMKRYFGSTDFRKEWLLVKTPIPNFKPNEYFDTILAKIYEIEEKEKDFLSEEDLIVQKLTQSTEEVTEENIKNELIAHTEKHNKACNVIMSQIEDNFYSYFDLNDEEIEIIENGIKSLNFYSFRPRPK